MNGGRATQLGHWLWETARNHLVAILLACLVFGIIVVFARPGAQVYLVEARTLGATVKIGTGAGNWRLPPLLLCGIAEFSPERAGDWDGTGCDPAIFEEQRLGPAEIALPQGTEIAARIDADGRLTLRLLAKPDPANIRLDDTVDWTPESVLIVEPEAWRNTGALEFSGGVVIGEDVRPGSSAYLLEGRYEIRERLPSQRLAFGETQPVQLAQGSLLRGDRVEFRSRVENTDAIIARGFIGPTDAEGQLGFMVTAASDPELIGADFSVRSFGAGATVIRPNWTDRATRDPLFLALSAILGLAIGALALFLQFYRPAPDRPTPD